jgi:hypothetical protein
VAVKYQGVLPAHLVDIQQGSTVFPAERGENMVSLTDLAVIIG